MEAKHVINIAGTVCPPETDEFFNRWYDEKHIPPNLKFGGLMGVTRYQLIPEKSQSPVKEYPQYMTTYKFKDMATFNDWNVSAALTEACADIPEMQQQTRFEMLWRVQCESVKIWQQTPPLSAVILLGDQCPPRFEAQFTQWLSAEHIPDLLKVKGFQGASLYRLASSSQLRVSRLAIKVQDYPQYLTFLFCRDLAALQAFEADPLRRAAQEDWLKVAQETGAAALWRAKYQAMRTWQR